LPRASRLLKGERPTSDVIPVAHEPECPRRGVQRLAPRPSPQVIHGWD